MAEVFYKPPIFCQKCHEPCCNSIIHVFISKEARINFEFACLKCGKDIQEFTMDFAQIVAYCLCVEKGLAGYMDGTDTIQ